MCSIYKCRPVRPGGPNLLYRIIITSLDLVCCITCITRRVFASRQGWLVNMSYEYARSSKQFSCRRVNHLVRLVRTMVIKINVKNRSSLQICCSGLLIHNVERGSVRLMSFVNCQTNQRRRILSWTGRGGDDFQAEVRVLPVQLQRSMH